LIFSPLDLSGDEAYYWDWGRHLALGYYSKPPLIGWLMAFSGWVGNDTTLGVRIWALFLGTGTISLIFLFTRHLFSARAGFIAAVILALSPANAALNIIITIDPPLLFAWSLALFASWLFLNAAKWSYSQMLFIICGLGLGVLSKQMMLVFPLLVGLFCLLEPSKRHWLKHPGSWLLAFSILLFLLPPLWWNYQNDWITFKHTSSHFNADPVTLAKRIGRFFEFIGSQLGLLSPVTYGLILSVLYLALRRWSSLLAKERYLLVLSVPGIVVFFVLALIQRALPNWPAVFYPASIVLLAGWLSGELSFQKVPQPKLFKWAAGWGFGLMAVLYCLVFFSPLLPLQRDAVERVRGWSAYGETVARIDDAVFGNEAHFYLITGHRYNASQLAFNHPKQPFVYRWNPSDEVHSQFEIWPGPESAAEKKALIVVPGGQSALPDLSALFTSVEFIEEIHVPITPHSHRVFALYKGLR